MSYGSVYDPGAWQQGTIDPYADFGSDISFGNDSLSVPNRNDPDGSLAAMGMTPQQIAQLAQLDQTLFGGGSILGPGGSGGSDPTPTGRIDSTGFGSEQEAIDFYKNADAANQQKITDQANARNSSLFSQIVDPFKAGINSIASNPQYLTTGIDPLSRSISNEITGQNLPALTTAFGSPSQTTYENTQQANPGVDYGASRAIGQFSDTAAGLVGGAIAGPAVFGTNAATPAFNAGSQATEQGLAAGGTEAAANGLSQAANLGNVVTITGGGGAALSGASVGAGLAAGVGVNIVNSGQMPGSNSSTTNNDISNDQLTNTPNAIPDIPTSFNPGNTPSFWDSLGSNAMDWLSNPKNDISLLSSLYGLYSSNQQQQTAKDLLAKSDPFGPYRAQYAQQLSGLMSDPSSITKDPGYQFQYDQGLQAVNRSMAAQGFLGSGNMGTALTKYGQDYATNYLGQKEQFLSGLAGANIAPNFNAGVQMNNMGLNTANSSLASLGYTFGGNSSSNSSVAQLNKMFGT